MVEPRLSRGLRDLCSDHMLARQHLIDTARKVYELYGFSPLETPAIEYLDVLSGAAGQEAQAQIFGVSNPRTRNWDCGLTSPFRCRVSSRNTRI